MTEEQIKELFIRAAEVDRKLPDTARPAALRAINHGYVHDTAFEGVSRQVGKRRRERQARKRQAA